MSTTIARIRFKLPNDRRLDSELSRVSFNRADLPTGFELVAGGQDDPIGKSEHIILRTISLPSTGEANRIGTIAEKAVLFAATKIQAGVDLGKDTPKSMYTSFGLETIRQINDLHEDTVMMNDFLGLTLVDATKRTAFAEIGAARVTLGTPVERFIDAFAEGFQLVQFITDRSQLALELFSASRFETSLRARFLILVSAVETITDRAPRATDALDLILQMKALFDCQEINDKDRSQMAGIFRDLQLRSIAGSSKEMIEKYCGKDKSKFFSKCYTARSELVHSGHTTFDLGGHIQQLEALVSEAVIGFIRENAITRNPD